MLGTTTGSWKILLGPGKFWKSPEIYFGQDTGNQMYYVPMCACSIVQVESRYEDVIEFCENLYAENVRSPYLLGFMIEILEERLETQSCEDAPRTLHRALEVCHFFSLALKAAIHCSWWRWFVLGLSVCVLTL